MVVIKRNSYNNNSITFRIFNTRTRIQNPELEFEEINLLSSQTTDEETTDQQPPNQQLVNQQPP